MLVISQSSFEHFYSGNYSTIIYYVQGSLFIDMCLPHAAWSGLCRLMPYAYTLFHCLHGYRLAQSLIGLAFDLENFCR